MLFASEPVAALVVGLALGPLAEPATAPVAELAVGLATGPVAALVVGPAVGRRP